MMEPRTESTTNFQSTNQLTSQLKFHWHTLSIISRHGGTDKVTFAEALTVSEYPVAEVRKR